MVYSTVALVVMPISTIVSGVV